VIREQKCAIKVTLVLPSSAGGTTNRSAVIDPRRGRRQGSRDKGPGSSKLHRPLKKCSLRKISRAVLGVRSNLTVPSKKLSTKIGSCSQLHDLGMKISFRLLLALIAMTLSSEVSRFGSAALVEVAPKPPDTKLLELAKHQFNEDIWPAEEKMFRAAAEGEDADFSQGVGDEADPAKAADWKKARS
jgi:hypothetical protein